MSIVARLLGWLTTGGAVAAALIGAAIFHFGGLVWAAALLAFFLSGTALTMVGRDRKSQPEHRRRGRSAGQVIGTGGVAALVSLLWGSGLVSEPLRALLPAAFLGALATSAADTWATELGMLSRHPPRLFTSGAYVPAGTSGAVSLVGTLAGVAGAILIAASGAQGQAHTFTAAWIAGVLAMFFDSLLGATLQASFRRPNGGITEEPGGGAVLVRGVPWLTNHVVNLFATLAGAAGAAALAALR
ncbi:MAG: DUF92 domain-containing protein [bacterium]